MYDPLKETAAAFFLKATRQYNNRLKFLNEFNSRCRLTDTAYRYAAAEIKYAYLQKLLLPVCNKTDNVSRADLPVEVAHELENGNRDDTDLFQNILYHYLYIRNYKLFFENTFDRKSPSSGHQFLTSFNAFMQSGNPLIRDYLLTDLMILYIPRKSSVLDSLFNVYKNTCTNKPYITYVDSLLKIATAKARTTYQQALETRLISIKGDTTTLLKSNLRKKPILIDCWASWCVPCLRERPVLERFAARYSDKVDFIAISFDKEKSDWLKKVKTFKKTTVTEYLADKAFASSLADFFDISSIPRYIFIDKNGNVITARGPRPGNLAEFEQQINTIINAAYSKQQQ